MDDTQKQIFAAIAESLGLSPSDLDRSSDLTEDLTLSPIELNDLITNLSGKFNVILSSEDLSELKTVDDLLVLIEDNLI